MDSHFLGLSANRDYFVDGRQKLANYYERSGAERLAMIKASLEDEHAAQAGFVTLSGAEVTFIDLNIMANDTLGEHFVEWENLGVGQIPVYKFRNDFEIGVRMGHLAGGPPMFKFQTTQSAVQVQTFQYNSDEFLVPNLVNANYDLARFHEKERALVRLAHAMQLKKQQYVINTMLDQPLENKIAVSIPAYVNQGSSPYVGKTPFILDSQVQAGSVESTNIINAASEGGFTKNFFKLLTTQSIYQDCTVKAIFASKVGKPWEASWNEASVIAYTTGQGNQSVDKIVPPSKWEEAINMGFDENGQYMRWFGKNYWVQALNIIPVDYFLAATNKPAVLGYNQMEGSYSDEIPMVGTQRMLSKRYEGRSIGLAQPDPMIRNFIAGKYDSQ